MNNFTEVEDISFDNADTGMDSSGSSVSSSEVKKKTERASSNDELSIIDLCDPSMTNEKSFESIDTLKTDKDQGLNNPRLKERRSSCDIPNVAVKERKRRNSITTTITTEKIILPKPKLLDLKPKLDQFKPLTTQSRCHSTPELVACSNSLDNLRRKYGETVKNSNLTKEHKTVRKTSLPAEWYAFRDRVMQENQQQQRHTRSTNSPVPTDVTKLELVSISSSDDEDYVASVTSSTSPIPRHGSPRHVNYHNPHFTSVTEEDDESLKDENEIEAKTDNNMQRNGDGPTQNTHQLRPSRHTRRHSLCVDINGNAVGHKLCGITKVADLDFSGSINENIPPFSKNALRIAPKSQSHAVQNEHITGQNKPNTINVLPNLKQVGTNQPARRNSVSLAAGLHQRYDGTRRRNSLTLDTDLADLLKSGESKTKLKTDFDKGEIIPLRGRRNSVAFGTHINEHVNLPGHRHSQIAHVDHTSHGNRLPQIDASMIGRRRNSVDLVVRSTVDESSNIGGRHSNERQRLKHNYPLQIQKMLKEAEKNMPTCTLLEIKRLKDQMRYGDD